MGPLAQLTRLSQMIRKGGGERLGSLVQRRSKTQLDFARSNSWMCQKPTGGFGLIRVRVA